MTTERSIPHIREIFDAERRVEPGLDYPGGPGSKGGFEGSGGRLSSSGGTKGLKTEPDLKHIDRHLSMKKTIRKKIMRDLQQAFVAESGEKDVEIKVVDSPGRDGFLEVLRKGGAIEKGDDPKEHKEEEKKQGFWRRFTIRRNKR